MILCRLYGPGLGDVFSIPTYGPRRRGLYLRSFHTTTTALSASLDTVETQS